MAIKPLRILGIVLPVLFIAAQFVPVNKTNPPVTKPIAWDSEQTQRLARRACMDCHSNETVWPWYSNIAPVSWVTAGHVRDGRRGLNFSEWMYSDSQRVKIAQRVDREVRGGGMPDSSYLPLHPEARLSAEEKQQLLDGLKASILK